MSLRLRGIDVKGKIVIARYGGSWRGIKPKVAAEHGAVGCFDLLRPSRTTAITRATFIRKALGGARTASSAARSWTCRVFPGDPLTKGIGATKDAKRIDRSRKQRRLPKIPVLPISYCDALPLLRNLDGAVVPDAWRGALPITYHFGGKTPTVHLKLEFNWDTMHDLRRHRQECTAANGPTNGSSAATTTTAG